MYRWYDGDCRQGSCDSLSYAEDRKNVSARTDVRLQNSDEIMSCDRAFFLEPPATLIVLSVRCFIMPPALSLLPTRAIIPALIDVCNCADCAVT